MENKKLLVTGSSGFIGKAFCDKARNLGYEIIEYDLPYNDLRAVWLLEEAIIESDMVVHIAAIADLNESIKDQDKNFYINVVATFDIGRFCAENNKRLIFISTCCVYGNTKVNGVETEDYTVPCTCEPYATSKMAAEWMLKGIPNLDYTILRIGTTYGAGMREALFIYIAFDKILKGETIEIHGDGEQTRQYIYIDDLTDGIIATVQADNCSGEIINLCDWNTASVIDIINHISYMLEKPIEKVTHVSDRFGQIKHENISIGKAKELLNWSTKIEIIEGLKLTYDLDPRFEEYR